MTDAEAQVQEAVEAICALGCEQVYAYITALGTGQTRPEYQSLGLPQRQRLLKELRGIMAVYDAPRD